MVWRGKELRSQHKTPLAQIVGVDCVIYSMKLRDHLGRTFGLFLENSGAIRMDD